MSAHGQKVLCAVNLTKPLLAAIEEISEKYRLSRNTAIELLLAVGIQTLRKWEAEVEDVEAAILLREKRQESLARSKPTSSKGTPAGGTRMTTGGGNPND
jgi:metal-responsive CopG/Arc/MetJ family transcriptional regulator